MQQAKDTLGTVASIVSNPDVLGLVKKILPLLPLDTKNLEPLLSKTVTAAQLVTMFSSTMGEKALQ
ncbi:MAG: hypothetical protein FJZ00_12270 [Candidatus Sericytochromatia bacterium]|uniref:Uncharacterized protein n=1 Tax=Candidatus Tanganyikabacteria bacterium TaxID=2961651 RepID=A0A937X4J0_9BACT|nr:hypothetical protein [Candidatus Tanganyikabacteria bacterium]